MGRHTRMDKPRQWRTMGITEGLADPIFTWSSVVFLGSLIVGAVASLLIFASANVKERISNAAIAEASARGEEAKAEAARANEAVAVAKAEAEKARLEQEKLKQQLAWRRLTSEQFRIIVEHFAAQDLASSGPKIALTVVAGDPEAMLFATDFKKALAQAGIKIPINHAMIAGTSPVMGIIVSGPRADVIHVATAFTKAGLTVVGNEQAGDVEILIGSKPPSE